MDVEKTMQFILDVQAATAVKLDQLAERTAANEAVLAAQIAENKQYLSQFSNLMMTWVERHDRRMDQLTERMDQLTEKVDRTSEKVDQTTENMNALVKVVDGLIRRDNGRTH